uniref:Secreted protein n=1 Tax=Rhizophora mucronata TaxID=61149 RepID=A0A2P2PTY9_RHIMU
MVSFISGILQFCLVTFLSRAMHIALSLSRTTEWPAAFIKIKKLWLNISPKKKVYTYRVAIKFVPFNEFFS